MNSNLKINFLSTDNIFFPSIPGNWNLVQARFLGIFTGAGIDKKISEEEIPVRMINYLDVYRAENKKIVSNEDLMITTATAEKIKAAKVNVGDLLITPSSETPDDIGHSAVVKEVGQDTVYSYHLTRFIPGKNIFPDFANYVFNSGPVRNYLGSVCTGTTRMVLSRDDFKSTPIPVPPIEQQIYIANFLDKEIDKINELIRKQEILIDSLKERRVSLICKVATTGISNLGKFIDSGIPWVSKIPDGWKVMPLYSLATENKQSNKGMVESNLLSLSFGRIVKKDINSSEGLLPESFETYQVLEKDYLVFRLTDLQNDKRSLRSAISLEKGIITSAYLAVIPKKINPQYLNYLMRAYDLMKVFYSMGGGLRQSMKFSDLKRLPVLLPPEKEQVDIVRFLDEELMNQDYLIEKANRLIELLNERRESLISGSISGNIDVRELA